MKRSDVGSGVIVLFIAMLSWGGLFPAGKLVLAALDPYYLSAIRYGVTSILFLLILWIAEGRTAFRFDGHVRELILLGSVGFAGFSLFCFEGLRLTTPQQAAVIAAMQPIVITAYQRVAHGVRLAPMTLGCVMLALIGCIVVVTRGDMATLTDGGSILGGLLVFSGSVCWIVYTFGAARFRGWSPVRYTALSCLFGTLAILFFTALATFIGRAHMPTTASVESVAAPLGFMIVMSSVVGVLLWNVGVHKLGPLNAALFGNFVPVIAFAIGAAQGYAIHAAEVVGALFVIAALIGNNLYLRWSLSTSTN